MASFSTLPAQVNPRLKYFRSLGIAANSSAPPKTRTISFSTTVQNSVQQKDLEFDFQLSENDINGSNSNSQKAINSPRRQNRSLSVPFSSQSAPSQSAPVAIQKNALGLFQDMSDEDEDSKKYNDDNSSEEGMNKFHKYQHGFMSGSFHNEDEFIVGTAPAVTWEKNHFMNKYKL